MNGIFADQVVGRKNIVFSIALFLIMGVLFGIPLTIDLFGGSLLSLDQYQAWKVIHGYSVFLAFINFFFGMCIDRMNLTSQEKEIASWSFILAGVVGGLGRMTLVLLSALGAYGRVASLLETMLFVLGTLVFVRGQARGRQARLVKGAAPASR